MRPITDHIPKPMVEVAGRTLIERALDQVGQYGIDKAVVNTAYKAEMLVQHLQARENPAVIFSHETQALETGGGMLNALPLLGEGSFFSLNSDTICIDTQQSSLARLESVFRDSDYDIVMLLHPLERAIGYGGLGDFFLEKDGCLKRRGTYSRAPYVFTGIQLIHSRIFFDCPSGPFSMNMLYDRGKKEDGTLAKRITGIVHDGDWLHVGDPQGLALANEYFSAENTR